MLHLFSFFNQVHGSEFSNVIVDETSSVSKGKLDMIMFISGLVCEEIFTLHPKMRDDGVIIEGEDEVFTVSTDPGETLPNKFVNEAMRFWFFDNWGIESLHSFNFLGFSSYEDVFEVPANCFYFWQFRHF